MLDHDVWLSKLTIKSRLCCVLADINDFLLLAIHSGEVLDLWITSTSRDRSREDYQQLVSLLNDLSINPALLVLIDESTDRVVELLLSVTASGIRLIEDALLHTGQRDIEDPTSERFV